MACITYQLLDYTKYARCINSMSEYYEMIQAPFKEVNKFNLYLIH